MRSVMPSFKAMRRKLLVALAAAALTLGTAPLLDTQLVLARYEHALATLKQPPSQIFSYAVSQAGAGDIEARHRIYRSGANVRDETLSENGQTLKPKRVAISQREDRYSVSRIAPQSSTYRFLFLHTVKDGNHLDYAFQVEPIVPSDTFSVTQVTVDGVRFLPVSIVFTTASSSAKGTGTITYAPTNGYWVPVAASIAATVNAKPAREHIAFGDYRFPPSLPSSTFATPRPLPTATLPSF